MKHLTLLCSLREKKVEINLETQLRPVDY